MTKGMRTAYVTGGVGGVGAAVCQALAEDGLAVVVLDLDQAAAARIAAALPGRGHAAVAINVADEADVARAFTEAAASAGPADVLVACAGVLMLRKDGSRNLVQETPLDEWTRTQNVNSTGAFLCCREYARQLPERVEHGRVVTISSVAAQLGGYRSSAAYIASKSAIIGFTKALARELAPRRVTANTVAPGLIDAPMLRLSLDPQDDDKAAAAIPLGRIGTPQDVAAAVRFLASPGASYITGATIDVNGGYAMN